jgi:hypothetical protein
MSLFLALACIPAIMLCNDVVDTTLCGYCVTNLSIEAAVSALHNDYRVKQAQECKKAPKSTASCQLTLLGGRHYVSITTRSILQNPMVEVNTLRPLSHTHVVITWEHAKQPAGSVEFRQVEHS